MYLIQKTLTFKNHHNGASETRFEFVIQSQALIRAPGGWRGDDGFRRSEFGNGNISVVEKLIGPAIKENMSLPVDELKPGEGFPNEEAIAAHYAAQQLRTKEMWRMIVFRREMYAAGRVDEYENEYGDVYED